ncbi:MAG: hypothetical protein HY716_06015 [Planctomycetes bacterium]|nr:hypothetical protein [Planctomycetota bacterium]
MSSKGLFVLVTMAAAGIAMLAVFMLYFLRTLERSPQGKAVKIGLEVANTFHVEGVRVVQVRRGPRERAVRIEYRTERQVVQLDAQNREMREIAKFTYEKFSPSERETVTSVEVKRDYFRGSGCFQRTFTSRYDWEPPPPSDEPIPVEREEYP